ncbi:MAG TPA: hypothetical protein VEU33_00445, partial [Archangium sp.]|nr:hypothetical protein [Archangium sp.]
MKVQTMTTRARLHLHVLQWDFEARVSASVMAEFGDGLMAASPAAPVQDKFQGRLYHPGNVQQQPPEFLAYSGHVEHPFRPCGTVGASATLAGVHFAPFLDRVKFLSGSRTESPVSLSRWA